MIRPAIVVVACVVCLVAGVGIGAFVIGGSPAAAASSGGGAIADGKLQHDLDADRRELAACRDERRSLENELDALRRKGGGDGRTAALQAVADAAAAASASNASGTNMKRGAGSREPAAAADDPRTAAWVDHVGGDLALSARQKAQLNDIAKWAADQRNSLKEKAAKDNLDSESVRAEIADQRAEYEKRMKDLLSADEWIAFDSVQGVERRPPTFARMPDILGDQAQPLQAPKRDAGG